jgi:hypothetical protein
MTDYDKPRRSPADADEDVQELAARRSAAESAAADFDEAAEAIDAPGADHSDEELTVAVVPMLADEFRCAECFLVYHRNQLAGQRHGQDICRECF